LILQHLQITDDVKFLAGPFKDQKFAVPQLQGIAQVWWEAWAVAPCQREATPLGNPGQAAGALYRLDGIQEFPTDEANDWFYMLAAGRETSGRPTRNLRNTYGSIKFTGQVYYYEGLTEDKLKRFNFKAGSVLTGAGALYSYRLDAAGNEQAVGTFLKDYPSSGSVRHELTASWSSNRDNGRTTVETEP
jgi:hypothetical protein